jgi:hypothetical protein
VFVVQVRTEAGHPGSHGPPTVRQEVMVYIILESNRSEFSLKEGVFIIVPKAMKPLSRDLERSVLSILEDKPSGAKVNICWEGEMEDFFKL